MGKDRFTTKSTNKLWKECSKLLAQLTQQMCFRSNKEAVSTCRKLIKALEAYGKQRDEDKKSRKSQKRIESTRLLAYHVIAGDSDGQSLTRHVEELAEAIERHG